MAMPTDGGIPFFKMTGAGNDFILVDNRDGRVDADHCRDWASRACRRKLSVGADGLILIENDEEVDFRWRFFNADGSEAEMCGNGARCAVRFARLSNIVSKPAMAFRTLAGVIRAEIQGERVRVLMTPPRDLNMDLSIRVEEKPFTVHFINTGVPHAVAFVEDEEGLEALDVRGYGRAIRYHEKFRPAGANANFVHVRDEHSLRIRTYERGVEGETLACGTGCIAAALVASRRGQAASPVEMRTRGGEVLTVSFEGKEGDWGSVYMEGEARVVYSGRLWDETLK